jgi:23S rRNA (pseudouridine1915-N3)-methyltransferase
MKFRIIWTGSNADIEFREAVDRYSRRIKHFFPIEITAVAPERGRQSKSDVAILHADSARLLAAIPPRGLVVALDERGESIDSLKFARWLEHVATHNPHGVSFVLGGDVGLDGEVRKRADKVLSLSAMTLPHQIARLVLLEQIYRACTIMRNVPYHK